ncbi:MAG: DNA-processing protein DprA [Clostridiales bacterium]|nr:DNA-processing protein DprA [Clostridiales bacterium]
MKKEEYWYWLHNIEGIGNGTIGKLVDYFYQPEELFEADSESLENCGILNQRQKEALLCSREKGLIQENYGKLAQKGIHFTYYGHPDFPEKLKNLEDHPWGLYWKGKLPADEVSVAVVGTRTCTEYGKEMALYFAQTLASAGISIISGLARGIDGYAHKGALLAQGMTYGVLGCGIDQCYPPEHIELYMKIQEKGGILSEYPPGTIARPGLFPMRNRLISGLSDGIFVVEAKERSGSFITVDRGLEQGKLVFALPGRAGDEYSRGCNRLIKMGAELADCPEDLLHHFLLSGRSPACKNRKNKYKLETKEEMVYSQLLLEPKHINELVSDTGMPAAELMNILISLELKGYVRQSVKNYFVRVMV